jgi:hypothetical protein
MTDKPDAKRWRLGTAIGIAVALLMIYTLSIGPVNWLVVATGMEWIGVMYAPLDWAANSCKPIEQLLTWYLRLWHVPGA